MPTVYTYNARSQKDSEAFPGHNPSSVVGDTDYDKVLFAFDLAGRVERRTDQLGDTCTYVYDMRQSRHTEGLSHGGEQPRRHHCRQRRLGLRRRLAADPCRIVADTIIRVSWHTTKRAAASSRR